MGLKEKKEEIKKIQSQYEDERRWSWDEKDLEQLKGEELERECATEKIVEIIRNGNFTMQECEEILLLAQKRIKISTPVGFSKSHQDAHQEENDKDNHQGIH